MKVLVVGASGQLGSAVAREFSRHADVVAVGRADLDITDDASVHARVTTEAPEVIVNCAAYNYVDVAEDDPVTALNVNAFGVRALARAAGVVGATLVHYSSDFVCRCLTGATPCAGRFRMYVVRSVRRSKFSLLTSDFRLLALSATC